MQEIDFITSSFQTPNEYLHKRDKMGNHGGSPPNLGLKETTPTLGETRLNRDTFKHHHSNKNQHEYHIQQHIYNFPTKACTMIHRWNHKHWVKMGSSKRRYHNKIYTT